MISCSYNGWTDQPEDEREALEAFEASRTHPTAVIRALLAPRSTPQRKAA